MKIGRKVKYAMLVYQAGIANVFTVKCLNLAAYGRDAVRVYQGDISNAHSVAYGMGLTGVCVRTAYCNQAGDIINAKWSEYFDDAPSAGRTVMANFN